MGSKKCQYESLSLSSFSIVDWYSGVTRVGDTRGGNWGCHPSIFFLKTWQSFFSRQFCGVTPDFFFANTGSLFLLIALSLFIAFTRVSPHSRVSPPHLFYLSDLVSPLFFANLSTNFFPSGVTPWRVSPGAVRPHPPIDATGLADILTTFIDRHCLKYVTLSVQTGTNYSS